MSQYMAKPCSRKDLRSLAIQLRKVFGLENVLYFPVLNLLEVLPKLFPKFYFQVVYDDELPKDTHAHTDVANHVIRIKESVYNGACDGNGRDRMTIAHEIGHYLLVSLHGLQLQRDFSKKPMKAYEDPEWQANCFAGELLVAEHLTRDMGVGEVSTKCGVSRIAAETQLNAIRGRR